MPVRMSVTAGIVADCTQAEALMEGFEAEYLLADRGYDTNKVLAAARERGMPPAAPLPAARCFTSATSRATGCGTRRCCRACTTGSS